MHRRQFLQLTIAAAVAAGVSGCSRSDPLRTGIHPWIGYEPLYLAEEFGWLPETVQLVKGRAASDSISGLISGNLDAAALTLDETLRVLAAGVPVKAVAVTNVSVGADVLLVRPEITGLSGLRGRRVAVELGGTSKAEKCRHCSLDSAVGSYCECCSLPRAIGDTVGVAVR